MFNKTQQVKSLKHRKTLAKKSAHFMMAKYISLKRKSDWWKNKKTEIKSNFRQPRQMLVTQLQIQDKKIYHNFADMNINLFYFHFVFFCYFSCFIYWLSNVSRFFLFLLLAFFFSSLENGSIAWRHIYTLYFHVNRLQPKLLFPTQV